MEEQPEDRRITEKPLVAENERFAHDDCDEGDINGISDPAKETGNHKLRGRSNRRRRTKTLPYETCEGFDERNETKEDERCAHNAQRIKSREKRVSNTNP